MPEALPAPGRTGVRIAGDHFQWLVAWQGCVVALRENGLGESNPILSVGVEVDNAGNLDDVVFHRKCPPHPYIQVKYAVDSGRLVDLEYLTEPSKSGGTSILRKIAAAWIDLTSGGERVDLRLTTNRAPDPTDPLIAGRDARTGLLMPKAAEQTNRSARGRARVNWARETGLAVEEMLDLLSVLTFDVARDFLHLQETVSLQMLVSGLRGDDSAVRLGADWVAEQVAKGHRSLDLAMIADAVERLGLRVGAARAVLSIATLKPDPLAADATYALDWVDRFDGEDAFAKRRPKPPATWQELQADLEAIPQRLKGMTQVGLTGSLRQATAFATGVTLRMVTNVDLAVVQRGQLWASGASYDGAIEPTVLEYSLGQGNDIAIALEVAAPLTDDVLDFLRQERIPVDRLIVLRPPGGPKDNSIADASAASALAVGIRNVVRRSSKGCDRIHLFLAGPMGLALLLGHRWNRIAPTVVYEDLGANNSYEAAFRISA